LPVEADVTDSKSLSLASAKVADTLGPVYGLVANAGIVRDNFFTELTADDWDSVLGVNLKGVALSMRAFIGDMYRRKEGSVVAISSVSGERGNIGQTNYAASKAGVIGLVKSLAREGARNEVRVNAVAPGFIETDMTAGIPPAVRERFISQIPMRRFGSPEEIAWAVAFLLSPVAASYVSGEVLRVNGAFYM
jgi:acetoacetyl-CoA reductase